MSRPSDCNKSVGGNTKPPTHKRPKWKDDGKRHRNWCYTSFDTECPAIPERLLQYHVCQLEECPESKLPHFQGYIQFKQGVLFVKVKELHKTAHWEPRWGSHEEARDYCMKEESRLDGPWEAGEEKNDQGKRTDIDEVKNDIIAGMALKEVALKHFNVFCKYHRGIDRFIGLLYNERQTAPFISLVTGPSGCGKTRWIYDTHGYENVFSVTNSKWWDGYRQQKVILFDEVSYGMKSTKEWLEILDRYPYFVEVKGGMVPLNSPLIYLVNSKIKRLEPFMYEDMARRIGEYVEFKSNGKGGYYRVTLKDDALAGAFAKYVVVASLRAEDRRPETLSELLARQERKYRI